jgi:hypothetical protein
MITAAPNISAANAKYGALYPKNSAIGAPTTGPTMGPSINID